MNAEQSETAKSRGRAAYESGAPIGACPYDGGQERELRIEWLTGYYEKSTIQKLIQDPITNRSPHKDAPFTPAGAALMGARDAHNPGAHVDFPPDEFRGGSSLPLYSMWRTAFIKERERLREERQRAAREAVRPAGADEAVEMIRNYLVRNGPSALNTISRVLRMHHMWARNLLLGGPFIQCPNPDPKGHRSSVLWAVDETAHHEEATE